jgi:hypothetical protein
MSQTRAAKFLRLAVTVLACAGGALVYAQSSDTEWQEYSATKLGNAGVVVLFFDAAVIRHGNGHVEVWVKGLRQKELDRAIDAPGTGKKIVAFTAERTKRGYQPPVMGLEDLTTGQLAAVLGYEAAANVAGIEPVVRTLYEIDCSNRMARELSTQYTIDGRFRSQDTPREWSHVPPETAIGNLAKLVCKQPQSPTSK